MALTNITEFKLGISKFVERSEQRRKNLTRAVGLRALSGVIRDTRVDTGRARGNWQVGESDPPTGQLERADASGTEGSADTVSIESRKILKMDGDKVIWLHNGVDYIGILEQKDKMLAGNVEALKTWLRSQR